MKEMSDLICGKAAVGGNYNSTRDTKMENCGGPAGPPTFFLQLLYRPTYNS